MPMFRCNQTVVILDEPSDVYEPTHRVHAHSPI